jgi:quercetin dioxygenase-like cupin family protein
MKRKTIMIGNTRSIKIFSLAVFITLLAAAMYVQISHATPGSGVTASPIAAAKLTEPVQLKFKTEGSGFGDGLEVTDLLMAKFVVTPSGAFGWHQHSGPVWVMIASGTLTLYQADDPSCQGTAYGPGSAFVEPGGDTHNARNEGNVDVVVYATFMLPEGGAALIDAANPGVCNF